MRTLVIDGRSVRRELVERILIKRHYHVRTAADGSEALASHEADPAQLIIVACTSGIECASLCLNLRDVPGADDAVIIAIVDDCPAEDLIEILYAGANDYLVEPITAASLTPRLMIAERTLANSTKYKAIFDALPDVMLRIAHDCTLLGFRANQLAKVVSAPDAIVGNNVADVMPVEFASACPHYVAKTLAQGTMQVLEYNVELDVQTQYFEARFVVCGDNQVLAIVRNITDHTRAEMFQARFIESQKLESMGVLAGGIAHDFNNLLTGMLGNAALALRMLSPANPAYRRVEDIRAGSERAAGLTRQILAYSGQATFDIRKISLSDHVSEISHLLHTSLAHQVDLELELVSDLPAIEADTAQIQQLVMNLVVNAAESLAESSGSVTIVTGELDLDEASSADLLAADRIAPGHYVFLEVRDTGCGIDDATRATMFDPFFTTKLTGRGLGLAAVLGIVRSHNGGLSVTSQAGAGTTFKVYFPAVGGVILARDKPARDELTGCGLILVVDDEKLVRDFVRNALHEFGYNVVAADNGLDAVELFDRLRDEIVLVLLDVAMPVLRGDEALRQMRALRPNLPALLTSGFDAAEATRHLRTTGPVGFIQKPFTPEQQAERIRSLLITDISPESDS